SNAFNCELTFGPAAACGSSNYEFSASTPAAGATDGAGNVTLFLFPSPSTPDTTYSFTAEPPASTGLATGGVTGRQISGDTTITITLAPAVVVSGRLLDGVGVGVPFQALVL